MSIYSLIPDAEALLTLEPEELAGIVLQHLNSLGPTEGGQLNRYNFSLPHTVEEYPPIYKNDIREALMEAWVWLEREGLLAPEPGKKDNWVFITRRGKQIAEAADINAYHKSNLLPRQQLHPVIAQKVWATFLRGDYDTAVFQAFKEVEVTVRKAGQYHASDFGVSLMRKAFHTETGALTDMNLPNGERQALSDLFAGAIGSYKNPHSHRNVSINAEEAVEMIILASHLLRIVNSRQS